MPTDPGVGGRLAAGRKLILKIELSVKMTRHLPGGGNKQFPVAWRGEEIGIFKELSRRKDEKGPSVWRERKSRRPELRGAAKEIRRGQDFRL